MGGTGNSAKEGSLQVILLDKSLLPWFSSLLPFRTLSPEKSRELGGNLLQYKSCPSFRSHPSRVRSGCHNKVTNLLRWPGLVIFRNFCHSVLGRATTPACLKGVTGWRPQKEPAAPSYPSFRGCFFLRYTTLGS